MADDKKYLRRVLGECRSALPSQFAASASRRVQLRVLESSFYQAVTTIVLYSAKDNEVATNLLLDHALGAQRLVLLPKIIPEIGEVRLIRVRDRADLTPGKFGILEPVGTETVTAADLGPALFCIPGLAFGPGGRRLGRGGGYYDRMLATVGPQTVTAGLAYSFQLLGSVPESPGDRRINLIFTESALHVGQSIGRSDITG